MSGLSRTPGKRVGVNSPPRVRIPLSPPFVAFLAPLLLSACTTLSPTSAAPPDAASPSTCGNWFDRLDCAVARADVADAQEARIAGHPHLRTSRHTAALPHDAAVDDAAFARDVVPALRALDRAARSAEIGNLTAASLVALGTDRAEALRRTETCAVESLTQRPPPPRSAIRVPDDYSAALRWLGAYTLTRLPFTAGVERQLAEVRDAYARPLTMPSVGLRLRYTPTPRDPSGGNTPGPDDTSRLLDRHQPIFEKEVTVADDHAGALAWSTVRGAPAVQTERPVVYRQVTATRYRGRTLTQLVYTIWFGARPASGAFDLLAGHLDGLVWRVTVDAKGDALVYDTMHPCGCYHYFIPTPRAVPIAAPADEPEWAFVPQTLPVPRAEQRVVLRIATRTHDLVRATLEADAPAGGADAVPLQSLAQDALRALPFSTRAEAEAAGAPTHSAYGPDGLVPGTARAERYLFWPMGIASAGQMRQWGRHATAFVGRRHFDDADLLEKRFALSLGD